MFDVGFEIPVGVGLVGFRAPHHEKKFRKEIRKKKSRQRKSRSAESEENKRRSTEKIKVKIPWNRERRSKENPGTGLG